MSPETLESELHRVVRLSSHARCVRDLSILIDGDTITLQGRAASYYQKQVLQHAILDYLQAHRNNGLVGRQFLLQNSVAVHYAEKTD